MCANNSCKFKKNYLLQNTYSYSITIKLEKVCFPLIRIFITLHKFCFTVTDLDDSPSSFYY